MRGINTQLKSNRTITTLFLAASGIFCAALSGTAFLLSRPSITMHAHAENAQDKADVSVNVDSVLSLAINQDININVSPTDIAQSNFIESLASTITVSTNNETGYSLYLSDKDTDTGLVHEYISTETIPTLDDADDYTAENFLLNHWGYRIDDDTQFFGISPSKNLIKQTDAPTTTSLTSLTVGVKFDVTKRAGSYEDEILLSVTPNALPTAWDRITNMQDMTPAVCASAPSATEDLTTAPSKQLIDTRDNKTYWVSKLADGNCWMTQNLDLNITTAGLDSTTSDIGYLDYQNDGIVRTWKSGGNSKGSAHPPTATVTAPSSSSDYTTTISWDLGDYYWNGTWLAYTDSTAGFSAFSDGFSTASSTAIHGEHSKVGTYYQWLTAIAGTGFEDDGTTGIASKDAQDSICPAGWRLPTSNSTSNNYSFGKLTAAYSISSSTAGATALTNAPLYFVPAGYVDSGKLYNAGYYGYYWSSMAFPNTRYAYDLGFYSSSVNPSSSNPRYFGYSVRCVAR